MHRSYAGIGQIDALLVLVRVGVTFHRICHLFVDRVELHCYDRFRGEIETFLFDIIVGIGVGPDVTVGRHQVAAVTYGAVCLKL